MLHRLKFPYSKLYDYKYSEIFKSFLSFSKFLHMISFHCLFKIEKSGISPGSFSGLLSCTICVLTYYISQGNQSVTRTFTVNFLLYPSGTIYVTLYIPFFFGLNAVTLPNSLCIASILFALFILIT